jgi:ribose/xylose/arabinose/galactoside ABC-type transport system permease subunit
MQSVEDLRVTGFAPRNVTPKRPMGNLALRARGLVFSEYLLLYLIVLYLACAVPFIPGLLSAGNIRGMISNLLPLLVVSIAQSFVLITAGIDLSVTAVFACSSVAGGLIMTSDGGWLAGSSWSVPVGLVAMAVVGASIGWLNGVSVSAFKMPPFVVTLSTMTFFSGVAVWVTRSRNIYHLPQTLITIGKGSLVFVPYALLLTAVLAFVVHFVWKRTVVGRWLFSVGQSPKVAVISGVPITRTLIFAYVACSLCATFASVLLMGRLETASPILGQRLLLDTVAAPVIGGVSLFGGRGNVVGIVLGALFVTLMDNGLNLLGLSYFVIMMAKGGLVLLAALLDVQRNALRVNT